MKHLISRSIIPGAILLLGACTFGPQRNVLFDIPADKPGAQAGPAIPLKNPSFAADPQGALTGWVMSEHGNGKSYTFVADPVNAHSAPSSARIKRHGIEDIGLLEQAIDVNPAWINKTVRLSGWLKGENIHGAGGALALRIDGGHGEILAWNYMPDTRLTGTRDWKRYSIDLKVPPAAYSIRAGAMLQDNGTLWADDFLLELID